MMPGLSLLQYVAVGLLILANAFFVAAEFALVSLRDTRIEQLLASGIPGTRAVRRLQRDLDDFLPAVQLGVTLCSLALGWIGEPLAASTLMSWISALPFAQAHALLYAHIIAVTLGFALITYFHVVVGELVPKSLALRRAEALAVAVAPPMLVFMTLARPAVRLLKNSAAVILRGFDIPMTERAQVHSPEELKLIATAARRLGLLPRFQETLIHRALELEDVPVREIMTPRQKIFSLPSDLAVEAATAQVLEHMRSRVPVYDESRGPEHIVGVVYSKDLARIMFSRSGATPSPTVILSEAERSRRTCVSDVSESQKMGAPGLKGTGFSPYINQPIKPVALAPEGNHDLTLRQIMRDILVVPETKSVLDLLRDLQQRRRQIAIVVDEYGSTVGLVTAEDAIEQLTGELEDEFDFPTLPVLPAAGGAVLMDGGLNLRDLETQMQWDLPREGGIETLAGFVLMRLGHIPKVGESTIYEGRRLTVVEMDNRRIAKIRVEPVEEASPPTGK
ncbi:MAG: hemolysin family protein [Terracidiphilus sp.]|jgi:CBS domain containing-hemolysin-like protein